MATSRRMPGGVVPRGPDDRSGQPEPGSVARGAAEGAPFDPVERPLGMIAETWAPTEEPGRVLDELVPPPTAAPVRGGPSLTVWIIVMVFIVVVLLAVVSYSNAPP